MNEEGIDIAAPGSCMRGYCLVPSRLPVDQADEVPVDRSLYKFAPAQFGSAVLAVEMANWAIID